MKAKTPETVKVLHRVLALVNDRACAHLRARVPLKPARPLDAQERRRADRARLFERDSAALARVMRMILEVRDPQFHEYNDTVARRRAARRGVGKNRSHGG
jgi:hypothetical protein